MTEFEDVQPVSVWGTTEQVCRRCGTPTSTGQCAGCGETEDLAGVDMVAVLRPPGDDGEFEVSLFKDYGTGHLSPAGSRWMSGEQARRLARQGDVRGQFSMSVSWPRD